MNQTFLPLVGPAASVAGPNHLSPSSISKQQPEKLPAGQDFFGLISRTQKKSEISGKEKNKVQSDPATDDGDSTKPASDTDPVVTSVLLAMMIQPLAAPEAAKAPTLEAGNSDVEGTSDDESVSTVQADGKSKTAQVLTKAEAGQEALVEVAGEEKGQNPEKGVKEAKKAPETKDAKANPAENAAQGKGGETAAKVSSKDAQHIKQELHASNIKTAEQALSSHGMAAALNEERMKFASEKNEIAGSVQKLPRERAVRGVEASATHATAADSSAANAKSSDSNADLGGKKENSNPSPVTLETNVKITVVDSAQGGGVDKAQATDRSAAQVERVAQMVNREVAIIRQSGATAMAVTLKVDAHTDLLLQLTNHNGQMQAMLRCERGDAAGLNHHWNDLQDSLAKQNVHLMPLENRSAFSPAIATAPVSNASFSFNQSSQNPQREAQEAREEMLPQMPASRANGGSDKPKTKTASRSRQGWESWA